MKPEKLKTITEIIWIIGEKPLNVTELKEKTGLAFGTLSYHLKFLRDHGIVKTTKNKKAKGQPTIYELKSYKRIMSKEIEKAVERIVFGIKGIKIQLRAKTITEQEYNKYKKEIIKSLEQNV